MGRLVKMRGLKVEVRSKKWERVKIVRERESEGEGGRMEKGKVPSFSIPFYFSTKILLDDAVAEQLFQTLSLSLIFPSSLSLLSLSSISFFLQIL